jgi:hypothetical protein
MKNKDLARSSIGGKGKVLVIALGASALVALLAANGCSSVVKNRDPLGQQFPAVTGETLAGTPTALPLDEPAVLLLGYVQDAQFDADRWLIGLLQAPPSVRILEVPTMPGIFPRLIADTIDTGMRGGIPNEDWESVVTVYGEQAERIIALTGNERARNIRVLLVDSEGQVRWFHDRGFSAAKLLELGRAAGELSATTHE